MGTGYSAAAAIGSRLARVAQAVLLGCVLISASPAAESPSKTWAGGGTGVAWRLDPKQIDSSCRTAIESAHENVRAVIAQRDARSDMAALIAIETAIANMHDALVAQKLLASAAVDKAVRAASARCNEAVGAFGVEISANSGIHALAKAARGETQADRQLAKMYVEAGRRAGAHPDPDVRAEVGELLERLNSLQIDFQQALAEHASAVEITSAEAESLPEDVVATLAQTTEGYVFPVDFSPLAEQFMTHMESAAARRRFQEAFFERGGEDNSRRVAQAVALRDRIAKLSGFESWAALQLDTKMARTPERALALLREIDAKLMPKAREEIATLAALKAAGGDETPFSAWDYACFQAQLERSRFDVDAGAVRQYLPVDRVVPAVLEMIQELFGVAFHRVQADETWAPGVSQYAITDGKGREPIGWFFLDLVPRPGKFQRPATFGLRAGRQRPDGRYVLPIAAIVGNGPSSAEGQAALFSHRDFTEFLHELGHVMHSTLSTAPYATLYGTNVRGDFVETPSQMLENWAWQPSVLKRLSSHVDTGKPMPDELIDDLLRSRNSDAGVFWTRQAFLGIYDMTLHTSGPEVDPDALWFELMPQSTPLPPVPGTMPSASFLPVMGGYDAGYYGYVWSRVFAQDLFSVFEREGLDDSEVGMRFRREILEPGGTIEPDRLLRNFLDRPPSYDAFYTELGIDVDE
ncbi:MAG: M3 family metallopeptidase [Gammaproteobacteria bacterium]